MSALTTLDKCSNIEHKAPPVVQKNHTIPQLRCLLLSCIKCIILYYHVLSGQTEPGMMSYCNDDLCVLYCVGFMWDLVMNMWWPEIAFFVLIGNWLVLRSLWEITQ